MNFGGKVHGGAVMKWIDQAGYACAVGWSGRYCVTLYVGGIRFYKPSLIGNMVEVRARVIYTGKTSMHIAVDEDGKPVGVTPWEPQTEEEAAMERYAIRLMELRRSIEDEMQSHRGS